MSGVYVIPKEIRCFICNGDGEIEELREVSADPPTLKYTGDTITCRLCHGTGRIEFP